MLRAPESGGTPPDPHPVTALVGRIRPVDDRLLDAAAAHHARLTKPVGSLGRLEDLGGRLAAISGTVPPPVPTRPAIAVFAADHGVVAAGVTPWPQEVTTQMVANFCAGGAAINVLGRGVGASLTVVDVGTVGNAPDHPLLSVRKVRAGTANLAEGSAMSLDDAASAVLVGASVAQELVAGGADLLVGGEMGIGNTTPAAAVIASLTGRTAAEVTGRGTGVDDAVLAHKREVVARAVGRAEGRADPLAVLAEVGGLEIGALTGFYLGAAVARVPVVVDGVIAAAGALLAVRLCPAAAGYLIAGHRSTEPGATIALEALSLEPLLELGLRLGEGSGAALAVPVVQAAAALMAEMATFDSAGVDDGPA